MKKRWKAEASYRTGETASVGSVRVFTFEVDDITDLQQHVENLPPWGAMIEMKVTYQLGDGKLTIKDAEKM